MTRSDLLDNIEIFWTNVIWHAENKNIKLSIFMNGNMSALKSEKKVNVTLKKVQEIAEILDIDDYAVLFSQ